MHSIPGQGSPGPGPPGPGPGPRARAPGALGPGPGPQARLSAPRRPNKRLIQAKNLLRNPPWRRLRRRPQGASRPGEGGISKQISAWMSRLLLPWPARRPSRLQERTWPRIYFGASMNICSCSSFQCDVQASLSHVQGSWDGKAVETGGNCSGSGGIKNR